MSDESSVLPEKCKKIKPQNEENNVQLATSKLCETHLNRSFAIVESSAEESFYCKTTDCPGWFLYEQEDKDFFCSICQHVNCFSCNVIHEGKTCQEDWSYFWSQMRQNVENSSSQKDYEMLVKLDEVLLVSNPNPFSCAVCFGDIAKDEGVILHECLHCFCRPCLISTVQHSETPTVKCPFIDEIYKCDSDLQEMEIKSLVSFELYEKHLQRSITVAEGCAENSFHCKTPNCPGWYFYDDNVLDIRCGTCGHTSCRSCDVIHEGKTCEQYQELKTIVLQKQSDAEQECLTKIHIDELIKREEAMPCPKCKAILKKDGGCDAILCAICRTEVCWATKGPRWGPELCFAEKRSVKISKELFEKDHVIQTFLCFCLKLCFAEKRSVKISKELFEKEHVIQTFLCF